MTRVVVWEALSLVLLWTCFCRAVRTDQSTRFDIRLSLWALGLASLICIGAPVYGWQPDTVVMTLLASVVLVQVSTSALWRQGVPGSFANGPHMPQGSP